MHGPIAGAEHEVTRVERDALGDGELSGIVRLWAARDLRVFHRGALLETAGEQQRRSRSVIPS